MINWKNKFCWNFGLWPLSVKKAGIIDIYSIWSSLLMNFVMLFVSKFMGFSNLCCSFYMLLWCCHKEVFLCCCSDISYMFFLYVLVFLKHLVTVLILECPLFTSSEMHMLFITVSCLASWLEILFRVLPYACIVVQCFSLFKKYHFYHSKYHFYGKPRKIKRSY